MIYKHLNVPLAALLRDFQYENLQAFKQALLHWVADHETGIFLDSAATPGRWQFLAAVKPVRHLQCPAGNAFEQLRQWYDEQPGWLFGALAYDLKNEVERLQSAHFDGIQFPDLYFFQPEIVLGFRDGQVEVYSLLETPENILFGVRNAGAPSFPGRAGEGYGMRSDEAPQTPKHQNPKTQSTHSAFLQARLPRAEYLSTVARIREHIIEGDLYEMNLCQEFYATPVQIDPLAVYERLSALAQAPASAWFRLADKYLMCASPERFIQKQGDKLISQPIKGTRRRSVDPLEDAAIQQDLYHSIKDRAENVMIVDLVRNDLARHCQPGSVRVEELFGIYTFNTVHQMISTVSGRLRPEAHPMEALRDAFPMGSMTGAPKVMAMQLIERYERTRRGLYSGSVGYIDPAGDFDFNVVIRSIQYNAGQQYLSVSAGGAIVYDSDPEQEYEECLLKTRVMREALGMI